MLAIGSNIALSARCKSAQVLLRTRVLRQGRLEAVDDLADLVTQRSTVVVLPPTLFSATEDRYEYCSP